MWAKLLIGCLITTTVVRAEANDNQQSRSLFTYTESQSLGGQVRCLYDIVVLKDGTQLVGTLERLSPLSFSFGPLGFDNENVHLLSSIPEIPGKFSVITCDGKRYIGGLKTKSIAFTEQVPTGRKSLQSQLRSLQIEEISFIVLKPRSNERDEVTVPYFQLTFTNGDEMPVLIVEKTIGVSDGRKHWEVATGDILDVSFSGGLYGSIKDIKGRETELPLTFVKDPYLTVLLLSNQKTLKLPWKNVSNIQLDSIETPSPFSAKQIPEIKEGGESAGLSFVGSVSNKKPDGISEKAGLTVVKAESLEEEPGPLSLFTANCDFDIPSDVELAEDPNTNLPFVKTDSRKNCRDKTLALGEDFDLEEWEGESERDEEIKKEENEDSDDFQFVSQRLHRKESMLSPAPAEQKTGEIAYRDFGGPEDVALETITPGNAGDEEPRIDDSLLQEGGASLKDREPKLVEDFDEAEEEDLSDEGDQNTMDTSEQADSVSATLHGAYNGMVYIAPNDLHTPGFYIKSRKVTNKEYQRFVEAINYKTPSHWIQGKVPSGLEDKPVVNISYKDALLFAVWANKRLPTEAELKRASEVSCRIEDGLYEWTSTPSLSRRLYSDAQGASSTRLGEFHASHEVYSSKNVTSLRNDEFNNYTGFRVVEGSY